MSNEKFMEIDGVFLFYEPCCDDPTGYVRTTASHLSFGGFCHNVTEVTKLLAFVNDDNGKYMGSYELSRGAHGWVVIKRVATEITGSSVVEWTKVFDRLDDALLCADYDVYFGYVSDEELLENIENLDADISMEETSEEPDDRFIRSLQKSLKVLDAEYVRRMDAKEAK